MSERQKTNLTLLGSTGSIGKSTLSVIRQHRDRYRIYALTAYRQVELMLQQCLEFEPQRVVMVDEYSAERLKKALDERGFRCLVDSGVEALQEVASSEGVDVVMAAIVGAAGLLPTLRAAQAGKKILLANKEALVMSGALLIDAVKNNNATLLPVDSEHNAIFQCLPQCSQGSCLDGVEKIILTASGGPFHQFDRTSLKKVTPTQALKHPNWVMGAKVTIDSATLMNKGLELIEAYWLFDIDVNCIDVMVHPQSIIHSMVSYTDGSVIAQMGNPDMRTPIAHALAWPERIDSGVAALDFFSLGCLAFEPPDMERFPCLRLAQESMRRGGTATVVLNAANEVAVSAFLDGRLSFMGIPSVVEAVLGDVSISDQISLDTVLQADDTGRKKALEMISRNSGVFT